ncbi:MAG: molybdopterin molybdotransferase MoeA [Flavobacteriales bacterium]|nr:molybdopterin molybdotransferase MoeA [Flavobacteriales bacterium]
MISVEQAENIVLSNVLKLEMEEISLDSAYQRVLAENIYADRDFPPFNRVAMDGICIWFEDFGKGNRHFEIQDIQAAGSPQKFLQKGMAMEVMTGAMLPENADTVIRYEDLEIKNRFAKVLIETVVKGQNIHHQGTDVLQKEQLISKNTTIRAAEIGVLATVGKSTLKVYSLPKVAIISTGNELVEVGQLPEPYQIRKSNVFVLQALLQKFKVVSDVFHLKDNEVEMADALKELLNNYDVLLLSGAVSKGKFDFLPKVLEDLKVEKLFYQVAQRPGKPFWFGKRQNKAVFAFPGNPVSVFACAVRYLMPWFSASMHQKIEIEYAELTKEISFKPNLTYFLQVKTENNQGKLQATPMAGNGSGDLHNLVEVNAFLELPAHKTVFEKGKILRLWRF